MKHSTIPTSSSKPVIECGVGIAEVKVGMSIAELFEILGEAGIKKTFEEEIEGFDGYEKFLQFVIGFDYRIEYTNDSSPSYPIFKVWIKEDKLIAFMLSSYGVGVFDLDFCKRFQTESHLHIGDPIDKLTAIYGEPLHIHSYSPHANYIYPQLGAGFVCNTDTNTFRSVYIFDKTDAVLVNKIKDFYRETT
ncbi:MAG: hypothetical protein ACKVTZ_08580 [Bacteroidia bacterium]